MTTDPKTRFFTPSPVLDRVAHVAPIVLDPCADPRGIVDSVRAIMLPEHAHTLCMDAPGALPTDEDFDDLGLIIGDGLTKSWREIYDDTGIEGLVFVNPPYGRKHNPLWGEKTQREAAEGLNIISLVPASVCAAWFHDHYFLEENLIHFPRGRVDFGGMDEETTKTRGQFDNAIVLFSQDDDIRHRFVQAFRDFGRTVSGRR